jgi:hypothetical protein
MINYETNLLNLISLLLDTNYQIQTKMVQYQIFFKKIAYKHRLNKLVSDMIALRRSRGTAIRPRHPVNVDVNVNQ